MRPAGTYPFSMKSIEIAHVERMENTPSFGGKGQLLRIGLPNQAGVQHGQHCYTTRPKSRDQIAVHGVLVKVDFEGIHA